jgi:subtilisin family serine protease
MGGGKLQKKRYITIVLVWMLTFPLFFYSASENVSEQATETSKVMARSHSLFKNQTGYRVTLVTGDVVIVTDLPEGQKGISVIPADPTKLGQNFQVFKIRNDTYVMPSSVDTRKVDVELFNIDLLTRDGYFDLTYTPVIVQCESRPDPAKNVRDVEGRIAAREGRVTFKSPRLPAVAAKLPKEKTKELFETLVESPSTHKIWLDKKVKVDLADSVPLIGAPELWAAGYNGSGVEIAILDTGIDDTHPDLDDLDDDPTTIDPKVVIAIDFTDDLTTNDLFGHGTHVAGIAAGTGAVSNGTYKGVALGAMLWNVKVLNQYGWGFWSWVISGIEYAAYGPDGTPNTGDEADIISMSLGSYEWTDGTDPVSTAVDAAVDAGVVVAVAAGNWGDYFGIGVPATARKAITVGASDKLDYMAGFSSRGPTIDFRVKPDVVAPGVDIMSAVARGSYFEWLYNQGYIPGVDTDGDGYVDYISISGTSMSTPHVAGTAALMIQKGVPPGWLTPKYVKNALISTAVDLGYDVYTQGGGRIYVPSAAYTQILVDPATISFGLYTEDILDNATLTFYNLNMTSDVTLELNVTVRNIITGDIVNNAMLNTTILNIGASSSASVLLTINTTLPLSIYEGRVLAFSTNTTIHTIFGFSRLHELTVNKIKMDGTPASYEYVWIYKTNSTSYMDWSMNMRFGETDENGTAVFYVSDGEFNIWSSGWWEDTLVWTGEDKYPVLGDTVVTLDERDAVPIAFDENKADQIFCGLYSCVAYNETTVWEELRYSWIWLSSYPVNTTTYITLTSINVAHSYEYYPIEYYDSGQPWKINTPVWHKLFYAEQGVSASISYVANYTELAQRTSYYKTALIDHEAGRAEWVETPEFYAPIWGAFLWMMDAPQSRLEYISPNAGYDGIFLGWTDSFYWLLYDWGKIYAPGEMTTAEWNAHPLSPWFRIDRWDGYLELYLRPFSEDGSGNWYYTRHYYENITWARVIRNEETILDTASQRNYIYYWTDGEPTPANYTIIVDGISNQMLSVSSHTVLNFTYDGINDYRPPEIYNLQVPGLDLYNTMWPGNATVVFEIRDESPLSSVSFEYSTDDGVSWTEAPYSVTDSTYTAYLGELSNATVSLRINATDSLGNQISHTILRAFFVKPPITLADFPQPFVNEEGYIENTFIILPISDPHGPCGAAHTMDTMGGVLIAARLGLEAIGGMVRTAMDTYSYISTYDFDTAKVTMTDTTSNLIVLASPGVNQVTYYYNELKSANGNRVLPVLFLRDENGTDYLYVQDSGNKYYIEYDAEGRVTADYAVIQIYRDGDRWALLVYGLGGEGTKAAAMVLSEFDAWSLTGRAVIVKYYDSDGDGYLDTIQIVETVP